MQAAVIEKLLAFPTLECQDDLDEAVQSISKVVNDGLKALLDLRYAAREISEIYARVPALNSMRIVVTSAGAFDDEGQTYTDYSFDVPAIIVSDEKLGDVTQEELAGSFTDMLTGFSRVFLGEDVPDAQSDLLSCDLHILAKLLDKDATEEIVVVRSEMEAATHGLEGVQRIDATAMHLFPGAWDEMAHILNLPQAPNPNPLHRALCRSIQQIRPRN